MAVTAIGNLQPGNVHTERIVSQLTLEYQYPDLVGDIFAPLTPVNDSKDDFPIWFGDDENKMYDTAAGAGGDLNQVDWSADTYDYRTEKHGLEHTEFWETVASADEVWQSYLDLAAVGNRLRHHVMLRHEEKVATIFNTSGNYNSDHYYALTTNQFNDSGVNGLLRLQQEIRKLRLVAGGSPIHMAITGDIWPYMLNDDNFHVPELSILGSSPAIQQALGLAGMHIIDAQYDSADKGQTASRTDFWTANSIWLFVRAPQGRGTKVPSAAKTFQWKNAPGVRGGEGVRTGRNERRMINWIQYLKFYDVKATGINRSEEIITATWLKDVYQLS